MDAGRTLGVRGTVVPNHFTVALSPEDVERFAGFHDALVQRARRHGARARARGRATTSRARSRSRSSPTSTPGGATCASTADDRRRRDRARPARSCSPTAAASRSATSPRCIGRLPDCAIAALRPAGVAPPRRGPARRTRLPRRRPRLDSTARTVNGVSVQRARARRRRRDRRRCNVDPLRGVVSGTMSDAVLTVLEVLPARAALPLPPARRVDRRARAPRHARRRCPRRVPAPRAAPAAPTHAPQGAAGGSWSSSPTTETGHAYPIDGEATLGRGGGCTVPLAFDTFVSQVHARAFDRDGNLWVEDLGSTQRHVRERQAHRASR